MNTRDFLKSIGALAVTGLIPSMPGQTCGYCGTVTSGENCGNCGAARFNTDAWALHYCKSGSSIGDNITLARARAKAEKKRILFIFNYNTVYEVKPNGDVRYERGHGPTHGCVYE